MHSSSDKKQYYNFLLEMKKYQYQVIGAISIVVLVILALFVWQHAIRLFALNTVPILTEDTSFLVVFDQSNKLTGKSKQVAKVLNEMIGVDMNDAALILAAFENRSVGQYGLIVRGANQYWFIKDRQAIVINQDKDFILANEAMLSTPLIRSTYYYNSIPYIFWGNNEWEHKSNSNEGDFLREKKIFSNLMSRSDAAVIWPQSSKEKAGDQSIIFGGLSYNNSVLRLDLSYHPELIGQELSTEEMPQSNFYLNAINWPGDAIEIKRLTKLLGIDSADSLFAAVMPAKVSINQGSIADFLSDPFQGKLVWQIESKVSSEEGVRLLNNIIRQLSRRFPQVEKRVLPDDSSIFELKQRTDAFTDAEITIEALNDGLITYPLGQISYEYQDNILNLKHGVWLGGQAVENSCISPQSSINGSLVSDKGESDLWKTLDFSYAEGFLAICIR